MANIFFSLAVSGAVGTVLALMIYLSKNIIRKYLPSHWLYYMWVAVLIIMVLPLKFEIPNITDNNHNVKNDSPAGEVLFVASKPEYVGETDTPNIGTVIFQSNDTEIENTNSLISRIDSGIINIIAYIWLVFAASIFSYKVISYIVFYISVMKSSSKTDIPELREYTKRKVRTRICTALSSPIMTGVLFPVLFMPNSELSDENLKYVLSHETIHLRRFDILLKWFSMAVSCIHFYNPAVYLACKSLSEECEISCDAEVIKGMSDTEIRSYAETILMLLQRQNETKIPLTTAMTGSKKLLKTRFILIKNRVVTSKKKLTLSVVIFAVIVAVSILVSGYISGHTELTKTVSTTSGFYNPHVYEARITDADPSMIELLNKNNELIMSIPVSVAENLPGIKTVVGNFPFEIHCGKIDNFFWACVTTKTNTSRNHTEKNHINICTSSDGGKNWFVNPDGYFCKGILESIWFVSEREGFISYSGGIYGKGISKTSDGGVTWEHFMEHDYALPLSSEDALKLLKHQLIFAYTNKYGYYTPITEDPRNNVDLSSLPGGYIGDEAWLPYVIENLEITGEDEDYYTVPVIWDFKIEKSTGIIFKFYDGHSKALMPFDPYSADALSFAG